jgi:hypothetical protein
VWVASSPTTRVIFRYFSVTWPGSRTDSSHHQQLSQMRQRKTLTKPSKLQMGIFYNNVTKMYFKANTHCKYEVKQILLVFNQNVASVK